MISKLSEIHANAKLGENVTVEAFTSIHDDVEIGEGTWIGSNVTIYPGARIGKNSGSRDLSRSSGSQIPGGGIHGRNRR